MKYIALILTLTALTAQANDFKTVNGVRVELTDAEQAALDSTRTAQAADSAATGRKQRFEERVLKRTDKLQQLMSKFAVEFNNNQFERFVQDTRNERSDYIYAPDALIAWFTTVFLTKNYGTGRTDLQTWALNKLQ